MDALGNYEIALNLIDDIKNLPDKYKLFLLNILNSDQALPEIQVLEDQANDEGYLSLIDSKSTEVLVRWLLSYLPLFNKSQMMPLKLRYFKLLNKIRDDITKNIKSYSEVLKHECYYLFSFASIHPLFVLTEQNTFKEVVSFLKIELDKKQEATNQ